MPNNNRSLNMAKRRKNDEFLTRIQDIEKEMDNYANELRGKVIYLPCDRPNRSAFWEYFHRNFYRLGLKAIVSTHNYPNHRSFVAWYTGDYDANPNRYKMHLMDGDGDMFSEECLHIMDQCDVVITNPPFSNYRRLFKTITEKNKEFMLVTNVSETVCNGVFQHIVSGEAHVGLNEVCWFEKEGQRVHVPCVWLTSYKKQKPDFKTYGKYIPSRYPKLDNFDAILVSKCAEIPYDYDGLMAVPVSFIQKLNPDQYELVWVCGSWTKANTPQQIKNEIGYDGSIFGNGAPVINGTRIFSRLLIRRRRHGS